MLYLLVGADIRGQIKILGVSIAGIGDADSLVGLSDLVKMFGLPLGLAFIDGLGDSAAAFLAAFGELFPGTTLIASDVFWIAAMRAQIEPGDWDALLRDLAAVYTAETEEEAQAAADAFGDNWREKYPDVVQRLEEQLTDMDTLLAAAAALRDADLNYIQVVNEVSKALATLDIAAIQQNDPV